MSTATQQELPLILTEVEVTAVDLISPTFVRIELASPALADFGVDGSLFDQRIKVVLPNEAGGLASFEGADESWFATWMDIPAEERGHMRTYTVRDVRGEGVDTRLVVDFVLHLADGATGPGSAWAAQASVGDCLVILAPRRGVPFGGIEFDPGAARNLFLVGDETALPAIGAILQALPADVRAVAVIEVAGAAEEQELTSPAEVAVHWVHRPDPLVDAVRAVELPDGEVFAWVAGEASAVRAVRRQLVGERGLDKRVVAFTGYWRRDMTQDDAPTEQDVADATAQMDASDYAV